MESVRPWIVKSDDGEAFVLSHASGQRLAVRTVGQIVEWALLEDLKEAVRRAYPHGKTKWTVDSRTS
jgi:hypothetical protein